MDELKKLRLALVHKVQARRLMGREKRDDKTNVDRRANGNKGRGIDKATIGEIKKGNNKDKNIGRGENKSKNVRGNEV